MVIFGASGDLHHAQAAARALQPGRNNLLPQRIRHSWFRQRRIFRKRTSASASATISASTPALPPDCELCDWLADAAYYIYGRFQQPGRLRQAERQRIANSTDRHHTRGNVFYYLATLPQFFPEIIRQLGEQGLTSRTTALAARHHREAVRARSGIGQALNREIGQILKESQIYRIDHYLGKETVQNILVFRFANGIFEPIWNRRYIDHVQITVAERPRRGTARRLLRTRGLPARHDSEPHSAAGVADRDGAADFVSGRRGARRAIEGAARHPADIPEDVLTRAVRGQYGEARSVGACPGYRCRRCSSIRIRTPRRSSP